MKLFVLTALVVSAAGVGAQRMTTNPADGHLKAMFPDAAYISPHSGPPLPWTIYRDDPTRVRGAGFQ